MNTQTRPPNDGMVPLVVLLSCCALALAAWWPPVLVAALHHRRLPRDPWRLAIGLARHTVAWPGPAVFLLYGLQTLVVLLTAAVVLRGQSVRRKRRTRADHAARHLARGADLVGLTPAQVRASARRLRPGADLSDPGAHGVLLAETLVHRIPLRMSWEDIAVVIAGPRVGKTTAHVVPAVVGYRGPIKTSSNKPDVHDATRGIRETLGRCWVCDPQRLIAADRPDLGHTFWWDPLADVTSVSAARELVQILIDTTIDPGAKPDAYFHPTGRTLLVNYVFAAALAGRSLLDVTGWLGDINDTTAINILADNGLSAAAAQIRSVLAKPDRQRDGVLGTAQSWLSVITDPRYAAWITPPPPSAGCTPARFVPEQFVRSSADTMYLLSQEGPASAGFLTTALNAAIDRAALAYARTLPARRLTHPLLSVLDEAANTIRDTTLPDKVSHYGSRGLPTEIVLQSWSQGVEVWGERGMRKLWSAANIKIYLGGVSETGFLKSMSELLGDRDERYWTSSASRDSRGTSRSRAEQLRRIPIQSVAQLAELPRGRAIVFSSGNRPALGRPVPWMAGPHAGAIHASLAQWESAGRRTERNQETDQAVIESFEADHRDEILRNADLASALETEGLLL